MLKVRFLLPFFVFFCIPWLTHADSTEDLEFKSEQRFSQVRVTLDVDRTTIVPGESFQARVLFSLQEDWHIYWKNHGDYGLKPSFSIGPGSVQVLKDWWPTPSRISIPPYTSFGYEHEVPFLFDLKLADTADIGSRVLLTTSLQWLICKEDCIPQEASLSLPLTVATSSKPEKTFQQDAPLDPALQGSIEKRDTSLIAHIKFPTEKALEDKRDYFFIPEELTLITPGADQPLQVHGNTLTLNLSPPLSFTSLPESIKGVLLEESHGRPLKAYNVSLRPESSHRSLHEANPDEAPSLLLLLGFSILGGLILNVMPCVFPVISIKVLDLLSLTASSAKERQLHIIAYTFGILISLQILSGILLFLRYSGLQLGWGFQLQSVIMIAILYLLFTVLGFYFLGLAEFHIGIPRWLQKILGTDREHSVASSFFNGLLAVVVASPCTAPFLGAALGYALLAPPLHASLIFFAIGIGLALPFIVLALVPGLLSYLPRPGAWMERVQQFCAFPLFATSLFLLFVLDAQRGMPAVFYSLTIGLLLLFICWLMNLLERHATLKMLLLIASLIPITGYIRVIDSLPAASKDTPGTHSGIEWKVFTEQRLKALREDGRTVYVDFTASWCLTCQVNKKLVFSSPTVLEFIKSNNVELLKADWTLRDPEITRALERRNRASVPVVIIDGPGLSEEEVLPVVLTPAIVLEALSKATGANK